METKAFHLRWNKHMISLQTLFLDLLTQEGLVDVTLACEGGTLRAHKLILSACSPYFHKILKENPSSHPLIILTDVNVNEMKRILQFIYEGEVEVPEDDLSSLISSASQLEIRGLSDKHDKKNSRSSEKKASEDAARKRERNTFTAKFREDEPPEKKEKLEKGSDDILPLASDEPMIVDEMTEESDHVSADTTTPVQPKSPAKFSEYPNEQLSPSSNPVNVLAPSVHSTCHSVPSDSHADQSLTNTEHTHDQSSTLESTTSESLSLESPEKQFTSVELSTNQSVPETPSSEATSNQTAASSPSVTPQKSIAWTITTRSKNSNTKSSKTTTPRSSSNITTKSSGNVGTRSNKSTPKKDVNGMGNGDHEDERVPDNHDLVEVDSCCVKKLFEDGKEETPSLAYEMETEFGSSKDENSNLTQTQASLPQTQKPENGSPSVTGTSSGNSEVKHTEGNSESVLGNESSSNIEVSASPQEEKDVGNNMTLQRMLQDMPSPTSNTENLTLQRILQGSPHLPKTGEGTDNMMLQRMLQVLPLEPSVEIKEETEEVDLTEDLENDSVSDVGEEKNVPVQEESLQNSYPYSLLYDQQVSERTVSAICPFCYKDCKRQNELRSHIRMHTGEKPFKCEFCEVAFSRAAHLKRHRRVHTGERPFTCNRCMKSFSRQDKLKLHMDRHVIREMGGSLPIPGKPGRKPNISSGLSMSFTGSSGQCSTPAPSKSSLSQANSPSSASNFARPIQPRPNAPPHTSPFGDISYLSQLSISQRHASVPSTSLPTSSSGNVALGNYYSALNQSTRNNATNTNFYPSVNQNQASSPRNMNFFSSLGLSPRPHISAPSSVVNMTNYGGLSVYPVQPQVDNNTADLLNSVRQIGECSIKPLPLK